MHRLVLIDPSRVDTLVAPAASRRIAWIALWMLVAVFAGGTLVVARDHLRPPERARRFGWNYSYGLYQAEGAIAGQQVHPTARQAVFVVPVEGPWLQVTVWVDHPDVATHPVEARVWANGRPIMTSRLSSSEPVTTYVRVRDGSRRVVLQTWVNRVVRRRDGGQGDDREHGLLIRWGSVAIPLAGRIAGSPSAALK